jgi:hypothetical protein
MLKGPQLGDALREAMKRKGVGPTALARVFKIKSPSVHDWLKTGRIGREKLDDLVRYFSDVCTPEHWGITAPSVLTPSAAFVREPESAAYGQVRNAPPGFLEPINLSERQQHLRRVFNSLVSELSDRQCDVLALLLLDFDKSNSDAKALQLARETQIRRARPVRT